MNKVFRGSSFHWFRTINYTNKKKRIKKKTPRKVLEVSSESAASAPEMFTSTSLFRQKKWRRGEKVKKKISSFFANFISFHFVVVLDEAKAALYCGGRE